VFPSIGRSFDHREGSVVLEWTSADVRSPGITQTYRFIILDVQQNEFWPEVSLLGSPDDFGDVDASDEELQMLHH